MLAPKLSTDPLICLALSLSSFSGLKTGDWVDRFRFITLSVANYQNAAADSTTAHRLVLDILLKAGLLSRYGG